ncbi:hypothetical protein DL93DRAFT_2078596 [Clavulina sp. PMI_390]|nr:hypothetical protein DL93DRAFT_2078596 [Clavulina sp. PMI_390]
MRAAVAFFPSILEAKGWLGLGASHFYFVKEIPFMAKYEIRIHIGGWDSKWLNMIVQFVTYPEGKKKKRQGKGTVSGSSGQSTPTRTSIVDEDEQVESPLTYTPPTRLPSSSVSHTRSKSSPHHQAPTSHSRPPARSQPLSRPRSASDSSLLSHSSRSSYATEGLSRIDDDEEEYGDYDQARGDREEEEEDESYSSGSSTAASSPPSSSPNKLSSPLPSSSSSNAAPPPSPAAAADLSHIQDAMPPLPEGAVLHCIHVSSYCFKHGRITIPPRVALVVCGFGDARDGPKTKWERVQEIRNTRKWPIPEGLVAPESPRPGGDAASRRPREFEHGGLRAILRGGWKAYEKEGLWDLPMYEEQRVKAVEAFGTLRNHMASLNSTTAACSTSGMMPEVQAGLSVGATTA